MKKVAVVVVLALALLAGGAWAGAGAAGIGQDAKDVPRSMQDKGKGASVDRQGAIVVRPHPRGLPRKARRVPPRDRPSDRQDDRPSAGDAP